MTDSAPKSRSDKHSDEEVARQLAFVDGALGAAGHSVDDPESRELLRKQAAGEISADDAIAELRRREGLD